MDSFLVPLLVALPLGVAALSAIVRPALGPAAWPAVDRMVLATLAATALASLAGLVTMPPGSATVLRLVEVDAFGVASALGLVFHVDRVSLVVAATVSFVAFAVYRYSIRYLDGEARLGRFLGWLGFTIAAVQSLVLAGHLAQLALAWVLVSAGLHALLVHYRDRPEALRAARRKFLVSRLGDVGLVFGIVVLARAFGTLDLERLLAAAAGPLTGAHREALALGGFGFALAALCKSAQFPLHGWLPDTLEAPTPVSALMHAGVVNAGGYLLIRTSTLLDLADGALASLALFGAITACLGTLVTSTQTEVKKQLAWSTVAQMGFMILQCGLGATLPALVHLVGHSLYKAHAFLSSGVLPKAAERPSNLPTPALAAGWFALGTGLAFVALFTALTLLGHSPERLPGGLTLLGLVALGLGSVLVPKHPEIGAGSRGLAIVALSGLVVGIVHASHAAFGADVGQVLALERRGVAGGVFAAAAFVLAAVTATTGVVLASATARGQGLPLYLALRRAHPSPRTLVESVIAIVPGRRRADAAHERQA